MATESSSPLEGTLVRETNWWGAFVIGMAGVILVIGLVGYALVALGGVAIVLFAALTALGVFLCFCLAELAATYPDKAGGLPAYAFETFKPLGDRVARHVGGLSTWAYWLGWFTVAPINAFLAAQYIDDLFGIPLGGSYGPISSNFGSAWHVGWLVTAAIILLVMFVPCWLGIRLGATFATVLGIGSMVPLVLLILLPFVKPSTIDFGRVQLTTLPGGVTGSWQLIIGWAFIFTWTVLAMEAAACYIGECREPVRDAKIAMTAEGLFGFFIYTCLPLMVLAVLGTTGLGAIATKNEGWLGDANVLFQGYVDAIFGTSHVLEVGDRPRAHRRPPAERAERAHGRVARALAERPRRDLAARLRQDERPRLAEHRRHPQPRRIAARAARRLAAAIYIFSNMGYLFALAVALVGYSIFRSRGLAADRPLRMPAWMGPAAMVIGVAELALWAVGGYYAADYAVGAGFRWLYWVGLILLALYVPLSFWRQTEDRRFGTSSYSRVPAD